MLLNHLHYRDFIWFGYEVSHTGPFAEHRVPIWWHSLSGLKTWGHGVRLEEIGSGGILSRAVPCPSSCLTPSLLSDCYEVGSFIPFCLPRHDTLLSQSPKTTEPSSTDRNLSNRSQSKHSFPGGSIRDLASGDRNPDSSVSRGGNKRNFKEKCALQREWNRLESYFGWEGRRRTSGRGHLHAKEATENPFSKSVVDRQSSKTVIWKEIRYSRERGAAGAHEGRISGGWGMGRFRKRF